MTVHDAPSGAELLLSVREWLERDVLPATDGRLRFHARVAMNTLKIVEREILLGQGQLDRHAERLAQLGVDSDVDLAAAVRAGEFDERRDELLASLRSAVVDKLRVANPGYLDELDRTEGDGLSVSS